MLAVDHVGHRVDQGVDRAYRNASPLAASAPTAAGTVRLSTSATGSDSTAAPSAEQSSAPRRMAGACKLKARAVRAEESHGKPSVLAMLLWLVPGKLATQMVRACSNNGTHLERLLEEALAVEEGDHGSRGSCPCEPACQAAHNRLRLCKAGVVARASGCSRPYPLRGGR